MCSLRNSLSPRCATLHQLNQVDGVNAAEQRSRSIEQKKLRDDLDEVAKRFKDVSSPSLPPSG